MSMISGPQMVCPGCERVVNLPGICQDCKDQFGIETEEVKCPGCCALIDISNLEEHHLIGCHSCGATLELSGKTLIDAL